MGGELSVNNDRLNDFEISRVSIFTSDQGICLQRLEPGKNSTFKFDKNLAYGSWYDIQIIGRLLNNNTEVRYLKKGVYLSYGKIIKMTELTDENNRDYGIKWICDNCEKPNIGSVAICEYCHTNKSQKIITALSSIPLIGAPFTVADAILQCGKASQSNKMDDKIDAAITTTNAVLDVVFSPFILASLMRIPAKVTAQTGMKVTLKTLFGEAGIPVIKQIATELEKGEILTILKYEKEFIKKTFNNDSMKGQ